MPSPLGRVSGQSEIGRGFPLPSFSPVPVEKSTFFYSRSMAFVASFFGASAHPSWINTTACRHLHKYNNLPPCRPRRYPTRDLLLTILTVPPSACGIGKYLLIFKQYFSVDNIYLFERWCKPMISYESLWKTMKEKGCYNLCSDLQNGFLRIHDHQFETQ